jgi:hypothetical protein
MPLYNYCCFDCDDNVVIETICSISERYNNVPICGSCGKEMDQDFRGSRMQIKGAPYSKPLHSDSLAILPEQVAQHRKDFPNIELDSECRPVFKDAPSHQKYLDKCG